MFRSKFWLALSLILIFSFALTACQPVPAEPIIQTQIVEQEGEQIVIVATSEPAAPVDATSDKKVLRLAWGPGDIPTIDTALAVDVISIQMVDTMTVGLTRQNEETGELENAMATDVAVSEDGLTYTFTIKQDVPWVKYDVTTDSVVQVLDCEGNPRMVTAGDFAYGILRTLNPATASDYAYVLNPAIVGAADYNAGEAEADAVGVKVIDDATLEITFTSPAVYNLNIAGLWVAHAMPSWIIDGDDCTEGRSERWIETGFYQGYGPFTLKEWVHDSEMTLAKNPFWPGDEVVPQPKIDEIHWSFIDSGPALAEFEAGNLDVAGVPAADMDRVLADPVMGALVRDTYTLGTAFFAFNTQLAPTDDVRVRKALSLAVDREAMVTNVIKSGTPAYWFTHPGVAGAPKPDSYPDLGVRYDPDAAKAILQEYLDEKGITADQVELTLMFNTSDLNRRKAEALQAMWQDTLGIKVILSNQEWKVYLNQRVEGLENVYRGSWVQDYPDANNFLYEVWALGGGYQDVADWPVANADDYVAGASPEFDQFMQLITAAATEADPAARMDMYAQAEQILITDMAVLPPIQWYASKVLVSDYVEDTISITGYDRYEKWDLLPQE